MEDHSSGVTYLSQFMRVVRSELIICLGSGYEGHMGNTYDIKEKYNLKFMVTYMLNALHMNWLVLKWCMCVHDCAFPWGVAHACMGEPE